jgi:hypothetical protein
MSTANAEQLAPLDDFNPSLYTEDVRNREAVRYLFFPGDVIDSARKEECRGTLVFKGNEGGKPVYDVRDSFVFGGGGDEVASKCLVRTKGYLRKCRITPLERWVEPIPLELMPEGVTPVGLTPTSGALGSEQGFTSFSPGLYGYPKYPGEEIRWITHSAQANGRKGIVELTELFDIEWEMFDRSGIQRLFFPDFPAVPANLREVEELIRAHEPTTVHVGQRTVNTGRIQSQMLTACSQFRRWATIRIEAENLLLKVGTTKDGWTYTYSGLAEVILPQLEMARADDYMHDQAKFQKRLGENQEAMIQAMIDRGGDKSDTKEIILEMQRQFDERTRAMMQQHQDFLQTFMAKIFISGDDDPEGDPTPTTPVRPRNKNKGNKPK